MTSRLGTWDELPPLTHRDFMLCCMAKQVQTVCQHQRYRTAQICNQSGGVGIRCSQSVSEDSTRASAPIS